MAHELAHSWSGNLVTNATWNDFWLNEGFTVYFERRIMEHLYGREYADMLQVLGRAALHHTIAEIGAASPDTHLHLRLAGRDPDEGLTEIAYEKGCALLLTLEALVGRPRLDAFIKEYFTRFSFQAMDTATFLHYLRDRAARPGARPRSPPEPGRLGRRARPARERAGRALASVRGRRCQALARLGAGAAPASLLPATAAWSSHEWVHFLHGLPATLGAGPLGELDAAFGFTDSGNAEMLTAWFPAALRAGYAPADAAVEKFLRHVGRRKFLVPLYRALLATPGGAARARAVYTRRPGPTTTRWPPAPSMRCWPRAWFAG